LGAGEPDLSLGSRERAEVPHLHHGCREGTAERRLAVGEVPDGVVSAAAVEELLVGVKEPLLRQQVGVVGVIEGVGRRHVQRREVAVAAAGRPGAVGLERPREPRVDVGVVVDMVPEVLALPLADGVRPCMRCVHHRHVRTLVSCIDGKNLLEQIIKDEERMSASGVIRAVDRCTREGNHFCGGEALVAERGDEVGEVEGRRGQVAVSQRPARGCGVPASQRNRP
jgi:hypothetical protein